MRPHIMLACRLLVVSSFGVPAAASAQDAPPIMSVVGRATSGSDPKAYWQGHPISQRNRAQRISVEGFSGALTRLSAL